MNREVFELIVFKGVCKRLADFESYLNSNSEFALDWVCGKEFSEGFEPDAGLAWIICWPCVGFELTELISRVKRKGISLIFLGDSSKIEEIDLELMLKAGDFVPWVVGWEQIFWRVLQNLVKARDLEKVIKLREQDINQWKENLRLEKKNNLLNQRMSLKEYNQKILSHYLDMNNHSVYEVARKLEIGKSSIYRMLKSQAE